MDLQEVGFGGMDWNELAEDRDRRLVLGNEVINFRVPYNFANYFTDLEPDSFSRSTLLLGMRM